MDIVRTFSAARLTMMERSRCVDRVRVHILGLATSIQQDPHKLSMRIELVARTRQVPW